MLSVELVVWEELGGLIWHLDRPLPASDPASGNPLLGVCSLPTPGDSPGLPGRFLSQVWVGLGEPQTGKQPAVLPSRG